MLIFKGSAITDLKMTLKKGTYPNIRTKLRTDRKAQSILRFIY